MSSPPPEAPPPRPLGRALLFSGILFGLGFLIVELALSVVYFQRNSEHPLAIVQAIRTARALLQRPEPVGIWQTDQRLGYRHVPDASGTHRTLDFEVEYTIGPTGERVIPGPGGGRGEILFLGGSYTFGHGVADAESYPALLASGAWSGWTVRNRAVMGWGSAHAHLALADRLASKPAPALVVYAMIEAHVGRNYIRSSWVETLTAYDRLHPHFELEDGELSFRGVIDESGSRPDSAALDRTELELTAAFLSAMREDCEAAGVPLALVLLGEDWSLPAARLLVESGIPLVDLSALSIEGFPRDIHPNPQDHVRLAEAIAGSFVGRWLASGEAGASPGDLTRVGAPP